MDNRTTIAKALAKAANYALPFLEQGDTVIVTMRPVKQGVQFTVETQSKGHSSSQIEIAPFPQPGKN